MTSSVGNDVAEASGGGQDRRQFTHALLREVHALDRMLAEGRIESGVRRIGAEQEMFLVDRNWKPAPVALEILDAVDDPHLVTEVGAFNLELNLDPQAFGGNCFSAMEAQLNELLGRVRSVANERGVDVLLAGILPTIRTPTSVCRTWSTRIATTDSTRRSATCVAPTSTSTSRASTSCASATTR